MRQLPGTARDETVRRAIETAVAPAFAPLCAEAIERGFALSFRQTGKRSLEPWNNRLDSRTLACWQAIMRFLVESRRELPTVNNLREDLDALVAAVSTGTLKDRVFLFETADALIGHYPAASLRCLTNGADRYHEWPAGYTDPREGPVLPFVGPEGFLARVCFPFGIIPRTEPLPPPWPEGQFLRLPPSGRFTEMPDIAADLARRLAAHSDHAEVLLFLWDVRERVDRIIGEDGINVGNLRVGRPLAGTPAWRLFDGLLTGLWPRDALLLPRGKIRTLVIDIIADLLRETAMITVLPRAEELLQLKITRATFDAVADAREAAIWSEKVAAAAEGRDPALLLFAQLWRGEALTRLRESASQFGNTRYAAHRMAWPIMPTTPITAVGPGAKRSRPKTSGDRDLDGDDLCDAARAEMKRFMPMLRAAIGRKFGFTDFDEPLACVSYHGVPVKLGMLGG